MKRVDRSGFGTRHTDAATALAVAQRMDLESYIIRNFQHELDEQQGHYDAIQALADLLGGEICTSELRSEELALRTADQLIELGWTPPPAVITTDDEGDQNV